VSAGLRVAAVSNVSIVSVAALLGIAQLGSLFTDGFARQFLDPIVVGVIACLVLSLVLDGVILGLAWLVTPWLRQGRPARRQEVEAS
jgi:osmoprotectant transport system permease protein